MARVRCFAILTTDPRAVCWAGGVLEGRVVLDISTPLPVTGVRMTFYGEGRVEWSEGKKVGGGGKLLNPSNKKTFRNVRNLHETESYSRTTTILYGADPESAYNHILPAGHHSMPFQLPVPSDIPSSFEGCHGYVRYWLECNLDIVGHVEQVTKKAFTVISKYNLNTDVYADREIRRRQEVKVCCGCGSPGYYDIKYYVSRRGYVPGEKIMIDIRAKNHTRSNIHIVLRFKMCTNYHAKGRTAKVDKKIHEGKKLLEPSETLKWNPEIPVQPLPPTGLGGSRVIDIRYWLELLLYSESSFVDAIQFTDEIKIGTLPLSHITTALPITEQPYAMNGRPGGKQLLPVGLPMPEIRALPAPSPYGTSDSLNWPHSDGESGGSANRFHAYNGQVKLRSVPSNSSLW